MAEQDQENPEIDPAKFDVFVRLFRELGKKFDRLDKSVGDLIDLLDDHGQAIADNTKATDKMTDVADLLRNAIVSARKDPMGLVGATQQLMKDVRGGPQPPPDDEEFEDPEEYEDD